MKHYVASIDAGTGGARCAVFDLEGRAAAQAFRELTPRYTGDGRAEQSPTQLIEAALDAAREAVAAVDAEAIAALGFTGTQTTFAPIDREGRFLGDILLWQDMRGAELFPWIRERLASAGLTEADLYLRCGHPLDTTISGPKVMWLKRNAPELYARAWRFVTPQAILSHAFGGADWIDDACDGSWWLVHDGETLAPDPELLRLFELDPVKYPPVAAPGTRVGAVSAAVAARTGLRAGTPLIVGAGDQLCAALGAGNHGTPEIGALCLGTAGIATLYAPRRLPDPRRTYNVIGYPGGGWAIEAAIPVAASGLRWLRDVLYPASEHPREELYARMTAEAAEAAPGAGGVLFLPHLAGSVYPTPDGRVRGAFAGMSLGTRRAELVRAAMEGVCFGMRDVLEACRAVGAAGFNRLRVLGGASRSDLWNQILADVCGCPVETVETDEASALGAAMLAAVGAGLFPGLREACAAMTRPRRRYEPDAGRARRYDALYAAYQSLGAALSADTFPRLAALRDREEG